MRKKFENIISVSEWEIESDSGFIPFRNICKTVQYDVWYIRTESHELYCADTHIVFDSDNNEVFVQNLKIGQYIKTDSGFEQVLCLYKTDKSENMYDIEVLSDEHSYYASGIKSHNTTVTVCFLLWYVLFHTHKAIAVLANKATSAIDIVSRIETAYINLPKWLQSGVTSWNKGSFSLENGSGVTSAATSSDSVRGRSYSCVTGDTMITVLDDNNKIYYIPISKCKQIGKQLSLKVLTSNGFKSFDGVKITENHKQLIYIKTSLEKELKCTFNHKIRIKDGIFKEAEQLIVNDVLFDGSFIKEIKIIKCDEPVYDLVNVADGNHYLTNGITSHNCIYIDECAFVPKNLWEKFFLSTWPTISSGKNSRAILTSTPCGKNHYYNLWTKAKEGKNNFFPIEVNWWDVPGRDEKWRQDQLGIMSEEQFQVEYGNSFSSSTNTLISPDYFTRLEKNVIVPIQFTKTVKIYENPIPNHIYFGTVDCASVGNDYSTISIIDITSFPYKQVAVFKDNTISDLSFPQIIMELCSKYNNAEVLVESNEIGTAILNILNYDLEYEYIVKTLTNSKTVRLGQRTTIRTKSLGCSRLKDIIESEKLIVSDIDTLEELRHFVLTNKSYAAEAGYHDDLVMGLVNFSYYISTSEFKMKYDNSFTDEYRKEFENKIMEDLSPLPIFGSTINDNDQEDLSWLK